MRFIRLAIVLLSMRNILAYLLISIICSNIYGQTKHSNSSVEAARKYEQAVKWYERGKSSEAKEALSEAILADSLFAKAWFFLGRLKFTDHQIEQALVCYQKAYEIDPDNNPEALYYLIEAELMSHKYASAKSHLEKLLDFPRLTSKATEKAEKYLEIAVYGSDAVKNPIPFRPENLGAAINTEQDEYLPAITADGQLLIITRKEPVGKGLNGQIKYGEDFYIARKEENSWKQAVNLGSPINTSGNEGAQCLSPDGQWLFFTGCNRPEGKGECDIYISKKRGSSWSEPDNPGFPLNSPKWDSQPSISPDGKTLYFSSTRKGGAGGIDIWRSERQEKGDWSKPVALNINTSGNEMSPFIHPDDHTLYFASDGYPGMGGFDLFMAHKQQDGSFSEPVNLGYPINTYKDDNCLVVSADGKTAFYASDTWLEGALGGHDLYTFELYEKIRARKVGYVKGRVRDGKSAQPLEAKLELINLKTGEIEITTNSDPVDGSFLLILPVSEEYALNVNKQGYLFYSDHFGLDKNQNDSSFMEILLKPLIGGSKVVMNNVFFETGKHKLQQASGMELKRLAGLMKENPGIRIEISGHTDNTGTKEANQALSEKRAESVYNFLIREGITKERLQYKGYADSKPLGSNDTEESRARNRRTELEIIDL